MDPNIARRHGVVVVHGQGAQKPGATLAAILNAIADSLESDGDAVERDFRFEGVRAEATLTVVVPSSPDAEQFRFVEAHWTDAFPPPPADAVGRWILRRGPRGLRQMMRSWWSDPANNRRDDGEIGEYAAGRLITGLYRLQLAVVLGLIAILYLLSIPLALALYALYALAGSPGFKALGLAEKVGRALHGLDPFLAGTLGDTWRILEDGAWSTAIRQTVEDPFIGFLQDETIADVTVIAHSEGCVVTYDALSEGGRVGRAVGALPLSKRLTFVTLGSGLNQNHALSSQSKRGPYARRLSTAPIDHRITGIPPAPTALRAADTDVEIGRLRGRFLWFDIYARFDYVPAGAVVPAVRSMARIDPCQLKTRKVINDDSLFSDHGGYFDNADLVVPRLVRAIYGEEYPWPATGITELRARRRTRRVLALQSLRLSMALGVVVLVGLVVGVDGWTAALNDVWSFALTLDKSTVPETLSTAATAVLGLLTAPAIYRFVRDWWFDT